MKKEIHQNEVNRTALGGKFLAITSVAVLASGINTEASTDYGPAIWRPACDGKWYTTGYGHKFAVVHDMEGYYAYEVSAGGGLRACGTGVSVHYCVNGKVDAASDYPAGEITQEVSEAYYAWHARCWNQHSVGVEHEGFMSNPAWFTDAMYNASGLLYRHFCDKFGFAKDRNHIVGHNAETVSGWPAWASANLGIDPWCNTHGDPGPYWDWNKFMNIVNPPAPPPGMSPTPAVAVNADGHLEVFAIPADGSMWQTWQTAPNGPWYPGGSGALGGNLNTAVSTGLNADGRLQTFVMGNGTAVFYKRQLQPGAGWDSAWTSLGGNLNTALTVAKNADGRLDVFVLGNGTAVFHKAQSAPNSSTWDSSWTSLSGNNNTALTVAQNADGRLDAFVLGNGTAVFHKAQSAPNSSMWDGAWTSLGGNNNTALAVARNADGRLEVFVLGFGTAVYHQWQTAPNSSTWNGSWVSMGGNNNTALAVVQNADGRLEVFVLGFGSAVYHQWQTSPGGAWNGTWVSLSGNDNSALATGRDADGRLEVFVVGAGSGMKKMYRKAQTSAGSSTWETNWQDLGGNLK